jgi:hypothetical protein
LDGAKGKCDAYSRENPRREEVMTYSYKKKSSENHQSKRKREGENPTCPSPRKRKACHDIRTALLQNVAKKGT